MRLTEIEKSIRILVPSAWDNDKKGAFLEKLTSEVLRRQSYEMLERVRFTGMEIDLLATHKPSTDRVYVECKFHERPLGANVLDLMVGQGIRRRLSRFALFSVSPLAREALGACEELKADERFSFSWYGPDQILDALVDTGKAPSLPENLPQSVSHATLLIHPDYPALWLLQEQTDGRPFRILAAGPTAEEVPSAEELRALLDQFGVLDGLPVVPLIGKQGANVSVPQTSGPPIEVVSSVGTADDLIDYRPCRPDHFVGRAELQSQLIEFLRRVRDDETTTRLLSLVGASGFGKSSLVAKIAQRLRNKSWRSKFYVYPIDVRSARGPLFVGESVLTAMRSAAKEGFLRLPVDRLAVEDADNVLSSDSITLVLDGLRRQRKVLVIFFDQFEEALTKDELVPLFRAFRRFALDVHAKRSSLVIGFSWRTGISFSDDNPAYQMWNELRDHRLTKSLGIFDSSEASSVVAQFEAALGEKFIPPLRRRILEQGQGLPWLLKKLCIHVYGQIVDRQVSQFDLVGARLNVRALFDEDLEHLNNVQEACLRYIAANSPADSLDVYERYGYEAADSLTERRLVVRAGQKFAVYWDIFRDYLNEGTVPVIPLTYIPNTTLSMVLLACAELRKEGVALSTAELARRLSYSESTVVNIVTDLQNLAVCDKDADGKHRLVAKSIPDQLRAQFLEHVLYQRLLASSSDGVITRDDAVGVIAELYAGSAVKQETKANYLSRLALWLEYAGLLEQSGRTLRVLGASRRGVRYGVEPNRGRSHRQPLFLGSAPPDKVVELFARLQREGKVRKSELAGTLRNPSADLVALGLAFWTEDFLQIGAPCESPAQAVVGQAVGESPTMRIFVSLVGKGFQSRAELGAALGAAVERDWKSSSGVRYVNGLSSYCTYFHLLA